MSSGDLVEKISPYVLGIDLGTSTSIVSVYRRGRPEVLPVFGEKIVPSVVHYRKEAVPLIGLQAKRRVLIDPDSTVVSIKRQMGNSDYQREINGQAIRPEEVSALILEHLKNGAQEQESIAGTVKYAVVTIPANFNNNQREATLRAGQLAGLEILRLVEEPVAAAIAYGFGHEREQTILIYDLGGGTFDVCILKVQSADGAAPSFSVLGKAGIPELGGDDFDQALMKLLAAEVVKEGGPDILDMKKDQGISKKKIREAQQILKEKAEEAKIELSVAETTAVDVPNLVKDESGRDFHLSCEVSRAQFETAIAPLVAQSRTGIEQALTEAKLTTDDIDRIILVGGSTRSPCIRTLVTEMFGKEPYGDIDPGTAVSLGAAILGATFELPGESKPEEDVVAMIEETNTTSHFLGIEIQGQRFSTILEKGSELPCENTKQYTTSQDSQPELRISVFQFPSATEAIDMKIQGAACLGEFHLGPLEPLPKGKLLLDVKFSINASGVLKVTASSTGSKGNVGHELEVRVS